jgi:hypothetical protein
VLPNCAVEFLHDVVSRDGFAAAELAISFLIRVYIDVELGRQSVSLYVTQLAR